MNFSLERAFIFILLNILGVDQEEVSWPSFTDKEATQGSRRWNGKSKALSRAGIQTQLSRCCSQVPITIHTPTPIQGYKQQSLLALLRHQYWPQGKFSNGRFWPRTFLTWSLNTWGSHCLKFFRSYIWVSFLYVPQVSTQMPVHQGGELLPLSPALRAETLSYLLLYPCV